MSIVDTVTGGNIHAKFIDWFDTPVDSVSNDTKGKTQEIPSISGAKNTCQFGKPYPFVLGKHLYTPMYIMGNNQKNGYTTIGGVDGEEQWFTSLYLLSCNDIIARDFSLGSILLASNSEEKTSGEIEVDSVVYPTSLYGTRIELQDKKEVSFCNQKVIQEDLGIELLNTVDDEGVTDLLKSTRFSASYPQRVEVEFGLAGLVAFDNSGNAQNASVKVAVEYSTDGGATWKPFGKIGADQTGIEYNAEGEEVTYRNGASTKTETFKGVSTITRAKNKQMRFIAEKTFSYDDFFDADGKSKFKNNVIEIRITRINAKSDDSQTLDVVTLNSIRTWCFNKEKSLANGTALIAESPICEKDRERTTRVGLRIKANSYLKGQINSFNAIVSSKARVWDAESQEWSDTLHETNNPASLGLLALQAEMRGNYRYSDDKLDLDSFGAFYEWCDERGYYSSNPTIPRFTCNGVLTSQKKTDEVLDAILSCGRGIRIRNGKKYGVLIDKPRTTTVHILNNQNVISASNKKNFDVLPDRLSVKFINEENNYIEDEGYVYMDESQRESDDDLNTESLSLIWQTNWEQVYSNARYNLACRKLRPETWIREVTTDGNLIEIGNLVEVQDDTIMVGIGDGAEIIDVVTESGYITSIVVDGNFIVNPTDRIGVKIQQADGIHEPTVIKKEVEVENNGRYSTLIFKEPISMNEEILPSDGDIVSVGLFDRITTKALCFGKKDNGEGKFTLSLIPYDERIYTSDRDYPIPEFDSLITKPRQESEDVGTVSRSDLQLVQMQIKQEQTGAVESLKGFIEKSNKLTFDLSPEMQVIPVSADGTVPSGTILHIGAYLYDGMTLVERNVTYTASVEGTWDGNIFSFDSGLITSDLNEIHINAFYGDYKASATATISKLYAGEDGDWELFNLELSENTVKIVNGYPQPSMIDVTKIRRSNENYHEVTEYGHVTASVDGELVPQRVGEWIKDDTREFNHYVRYSKKMTPFYLKIDGLALLDDDSRAMVYYYRNKEE